MTHAFASIAVGTAAALMIMTLLLLRIQLHRRHVLALARRWISAGQATSVVVLAALCALTASSFASLQLSAPSGNEKTPSHSALAGPDDSAALKSLAAYTDKIDGSKAPPHAGAQEQAVNSLPAVDVMVAKLIARLKEQPNDVAGWKMLGWSYLNTNRPADAVEAYQTALKLEPGNTETEKALSAARAQTRSEPASASPTGTAANTELDPDQGAMIRDMVDRLAARLEVAPDDEQGWAQLMRARMVQGERDAAKATLEKARAAFKTNSAASQRLTAVARDLGVETPAAQ